MLVASPFLFELDLIDLLQVVACLCSAVSFFNDVPYHCIYRESPGACEEHEYEYHQVYECQLFYREWVFGVYYKSRHGHCNYHGYQTKAVKCAKDESYRAEHLGENDKRERQHAANLQWVGKIQRGAFHRRPFLDAMVEQH